MISAVRLVLLALLLSGCTSNSKKITTITGRTMGTSYAVKIAALNPINADDLKTDIDSMLVEVNRQMSTYIQDSEISKLNLGIKLNQLNKRKEVIRPVVLYSASVPKFVHSDV